MTHMFVKVGVVALCSSSVFAGPKVCITEIMYNPQSAEKNNESEWIEIANLGGESVDIHDWHLNLGKDNWGKFSCHLDPGGIVVLVNSKFVDEKQFREAWDAPAMTDRKPNYQVIGVSWGSLSNNPKEPGAALKLLDEKDAVVCEVTYRSGGEWPKIGKTGSSVWLGDTSAANCSDGKLWRLSEDGKDGAHKCKATAIFNKEDVASPGYVPGLNGAPPPSAPAPATPKPDPGPDKPKGDEDHKIDY